MGRELSFVKSTGVDDQRKGGGTENEVQNKGIKGTQHARFTSKGIRYKGEKDKQKA